MKIRPILSALSIASLGLFGVSCKSTSTASGSKDDGAYVGGGGGAGEYDNVYEMGGGDDYDTYASTGADNSGGSSYNYESNDYSSNSAPAPSTPSYTPAPTKPKPAASRPSAASSSSTRSSHTVERGDTLFNISRRYSTSVAAIQSANGLTGDLIRIGQVLRIP